MSKEEFLKNNPDFNETMFIAKINNIFVKLLTSIMTDKLEEVKHFLSTEVYTYAQSVINEAKSLNGTHMFDEINIKDSMITDYIVNKDVYQINVYLQSKYMDYIIDLSNSKIIRGNNNHRIDVNYNLTFTKKIKTLNQEVVRRCPGCGAPLSVNTSGLCEYCGSTYNQEDYDWILNKITRI